MRASVVAGLIVAVHAAVIGSVVMTQGCTSTQRGTTVPQPVVLDPAPPPPMPPAVTLPPHPVALPPIQPPAEPKPLKADATAKNVYVVKSGDSLSKIAVRHGVNARELAELNQIADANKIRVGQKLMLPDYAKPSQSPAGEEKKGAAKAEGKASAKAAGDGATYVVKSGDALSKIAAAHGVKTKDLMEANGIQDANRIRAGQKLVIPGGKAGTADKAESAKKAEGKKDAKASDGKKDSGNTVADEAPAPEVKADEAAPAPAPADVGSTFDYVAQPGDTVDSLSVLFAVPRESLRRANNLGPNDEVTAGQSLRVPSK